MNYLWYDKWQALRGCLVHVSMTKKGADIDLLIQANIVDAVKELARLGAMR
jgi:hypothetical protein